MTEVDTAALVATLLEDVGDLADDVDVERLPTVTADRALLAQVFRNLITNALKYVYEGTEPKVRVGAARSADAWTFSVADNGMGVPIDSRVEVFEPFERLEHGSYEGTGIGLSICRRIVERHGGTIWIEDGPEGCGSTFLFTLPDQR